MNLRKDLKTMDARVVKVMLDSIYGINYGGRGFGRVVALEVWKNSEVYLIDLIRVKLRLGWRSDDDLDARIRSIVLYRRQALRVCAHIRANVSGCIDTDSFFRV